MSPLQEIYIDTGERQYYGTGRNQRTTRIVTPYNNYNCIPLGPTLVGATENAMKLAPLGAELLAPYWAEFGSISEYKVVLPSNTKGVCVTTKHGHKPLGAILRSANSSGALILLPDINFYREEFAVEKDEKTL